MLTSISFYQQIKGISKENNYEQTEGHLMTWKKNVQNKLDFRLLRKISNFFEKLENLNILRIQF
jgi:hypothetical protein